MKKLIAITFLALVVGCKSATDFTGTWKNDNAKASEINTILVTALTSRVNARQTAEDDLAKALQSLGYKTVKSLDVMPPKFTEGKEPDKEALFAKIQETNADAILTVALIHEETDSRYTGRTTPYAPMQFGYYGNFWGYYNAWYPTLFSTGYYEEDQVYFIETNLYDASSQELLWSGQSQTYNPGSLARFSKEFANVAVNEMTKAGVLVERSPGDLASDRDNK